MGIFAWIYFIIGLLVMLTVAAIVDYGIIEGDLYSEVYCDTPQKIAGAMMLTILLVCSVILWPAIIGLMVWFVWYEEKTTGKKG